MSDVIQKLETEGLSLIQSARAFQVRDAETYQEAGVVVQNVTRFLRAWEAFFKPILESQKIALETSRSQRDKIAVPATEVKRALGGRMEVWDRAERDRIEAEQKQFAEHAQEEARLGALVAADAQGDEATVSAIAANEQTPVAVFLPPAPEMLKVEGISYRDIWSGEVTDLMQLVQAVAQGRAPLKTVKADQVVINGLAGSLKEALNLPGVRAVSRRVQSVKT